jgi:dihydroxyacid dehydratase/phosphogluconate dehydratase
MEAGLIDGSCMTVTGKTIAENLKDLPGLSEGQEIIKPLSDPIKETGHIQVYSIATNEIRHIHVIVLYSSVTYN